MMIIVAGSGPRKAAKLAHFVTKPHLKVLTSGTYGDLETTDAKIDNLMIKLCIGIVKIFVLNTYFFFYRRNKYFKVRNGDIHGTSTKPTLHQK